MSWSAQTQAINPRESSQVSRLARGLVKYLNIPYFPAICFEF